ncbi:Uncharacterised protein [uncultured archaeon]|nr:Uncharacterised protein [uncultured archaeon]
MKRLLIIMDYQINWLAAFKESIKVSSGYRERNPTDKGTPTIAL